MTVTAMNADHDADIAANDLTQLSSREQLSALMDGALPPDQTRFLLRRLQHDASLAECWQRWRLSGEVMRGLAPTQRLPADFALRVAAAVRGEALPVPSKRGSRLPAWLRWGGGAAMAASLAVVALIARQPAPDVPLAAPVQLASTPAPAVEASASPAPSTQAPLQGGNAAQVLATASAVAVAARSQRDRVAGHSRPVVRRQPAAIHDDEAAAQVAATEDTVPVPQPDIVTRPWPRSVLPQFASGGLTVGFGEHTRGNAPYNPFQVPSGIGGLPPLANGEGAQAAPAAASDPQREVQAQP